MLAVFLMLQLLRHLPSGDSPPASPRGSDEMKVLYFESVCSPNASTQTSGKINSANELVFATSFVILVRSICQIQ